ncbi:tape measure protein [Larkinella harenae]
MAAAAFSTQKIIQYSDSYRQLESRLSLVVDSSAQLEQSQRELFAISQQNRQPLEDTIDAYARLNTSLTDSQKAHTDLIRFTDLLSKTLLISKTNAAGAATFLQQFGQAASSDFKAIGQELQTFSDQNPRFYEILRDEAARYGKSLRQMAKDGELSFQFVSDAIFKASDSIEADASRVSTTVGKSFTQLNNSLLSFIGNSEDITRATGLIASGLEGMSEAIDRANENGLSLKTTVVGLTVALLEFYQNAVSKYASGFELLGFDTSKYKERAKDIQDQIDRIGMLLDEEQQLNKAQNAPKPTPRPKRPDLPPAVDDKAVKAALKAQKELDGLYQRNETYITGLTQETLRYNEAMGELATLVDKGRISQEQYYTALSNLDAEYDKATEKANIWAFDVEAATKRAAENAQDTLADFLFEPFEKGLDGMVLGFVNVLRRMAAEAAASKILSTLFGKAENPLGNLFGKVSSSLPSLSLGSLSLPKFAEGGFLQPGQWGIAGEREAELIYGGRNGMTIVPPGKMQGSGGNTYYIDARGADQGAVRRIEQALLLSAGPGRVEQRVSEAQMRGEL